MRLLLAPSLLASIALLPACVDGSPIAQDGQKLTLDQTEGRADRPSNKARDTAPTVYPDRSRFTDDCDPVLDTETWDGSSLWPAGTTGYVVWWYTTYTKPGDTLPRLEYFGVDTKFSNVVWHAFGPSTALASLLQMAGTDTADCATAELPLPKNITKGGVHPPPAPTLPPAGSDTGGPAPVACANDRKIIDYNAQRECNGVGDVDPQQATFGN